MVDSITIGAHVPTTAVAPEAAAPVTAPATAPVTAPSKEERPAWLPEKFKDAAQLADAYKELEQRMSGNAPAPKVETPTAATPAATPPVDPAVKPVETADALLTANGLDPAEFVSDYAKNGALSDASYEKLAAKGFSKTLVDSYMAGQKAQADQHAATVHSFVGGPEKYTEMVTWAASSLADSDKTAFNAAINSGDTAAAKLAVEGLHARFAAARGSEPSLLNGTTEPSTAGNVFRSQAEVTAAMRDPRYGKDPAYRKEVADKLGRSSI